jgi:hypothetical protein
VAIKKKATISATTNDEKLTALFKECKILLRAIIRSIL